MPLGVEPATDSNHCIQEEGTQMLDLPRAEPLRGPLGAPKSTAPGSHNLQDGDCRDLHPAPPTQTPTHSFCRKQSQKHLSGHQGGKLDPHRIPASKGHPVWAEGENKQTENYNAIHEFQHPAPEPRAPAFKSACGVQRGWVHRGYIWAESGKMKKILHVKKGA